jgi:Arc/MetJ-type ribon-helix-helix transcriptional regulator
MSNKVISISIPEEMLPDIDAAARREHRSRADLIREALRRYLASGRLIPIAEAEPNEVAAVERGRTQFEEGDFIRLDDLQRELGLPTR